MTIDRYGLAVISALVLASAGCDNTPPVAAQVTNPGAAGETAPSSLKKTITDSSFDDLKFEMEQTEMFDRSMLTPKVKELIDSKIRIRGYMYPTLKKRGLKQFVLVRDNLECCFGPGAALYDCILVHMNEGQTAEYSIRPIAVEGTLRYIDDIVGPDGKHLAIYRLDGDSAE